MAHWTLDDIPWDRFDPTAVDPDILALVKAAAVVEHNGGDYAIYLCNVFDGDAAFCAAARCHSTASITCAAASPWRSRRSASTPGDGSAGGCCVSPGG